MGRAPCCEKVGLKRGRWTAEEDEILNNYIKAHGEGAWRSLPKNAGLLRCGKSCRLRWVNYLKSDLRRGNISAEEENVIMRLHSSLGNRWSLIAAHLPGRTDNEIKNHWNSHLRRRILPTRKPTNPPAITIASTVNKCKDTIKTGTRTETRTSYKPSTITNHNTIQSDHQPQTKQQTKVDPCANSTYEDELLLFIENIMDQDLVAMVDDNGEPMSAINAGKEGTGSVISNQVEVGCTSSSTTTITREAFDDWNWDFSVEDGVLGFGGEEDDKILSWPWESSASIDSIIDNM